MARRIRTGAISVESLYGQLSAKLELQVMGGVNPVVNKQWYYPNAESANRFKPDYTKTGLFIKPVVTLIDPDTATNYTPSSFSTIWTEVKYGVAPKPFTGNVTEGGKVVYKVAADGELEVCKNVYPEDPITLICEITYEDTRTGELGKLNESITLTTSMSAEETYSIKLTPEHQYFNPLAKSSEHTGLYTIEATAMLGDKEATDVKYFWYYVYEHKVGSSYVYDEVLVDDADNPCLAYDPSNQTSDSGQGKASIVLDADYDSEDITIVCRIGKSTSSTPDIANVKANATLRWKVPNISGDVFSYNGDTARSFIREHKFGVLFRQQGKDIADAISKERIMKQWRLKKSNSTTSTNLGWGHEMTVKESMLLDKNNPAVVSADGYLLSPYQAVVLYEKVTNTSGKNPKNEGWYVLVSGEYVETADTTPNSGTTYYIEQVVVANDGGTEKIVTGRTV